MTAQPGMDPGFVPDGWRPQQRPADGRPAASPQAQKGEAAKVSAADIREVLGQLQKGLAAILQALNTDMQAITSSAAKVEELSGKVSEATALVNELGSLLSSFMSSQELLRKALGDIRDEIAKSAKSFAEPRLREFISRAVTWYHLITSDHPGLGEEGKRLLAGVAARLQDDLAVMGVRAFTAMAGQEYNPRIHDAVTTAWVRTPNAALDGRIAKVVEAGFETADGNLVCPAKVMLYRYDAAGASS